MDKDAGEYHLKTGEQITITLPNFGTAGYQLFFRTDNDAIVSTERLVRARPADDDRLIGSAVPVTYTITAIAKGIVNISFYEKRMWESNANELTVKEIRVYVQ